MPLVWAASKLALARSDREGHRDATPFAMQMRLATLALAPDSEIRAGDPGVMGTAECTRELFEGNFSPLGALTNHWKSMR